MDESTGRESTHKRAALFSAILAAALAIVEIGSHAAQDRAGSFGSQAREFWGLYQDKTIQQTVLQGFVDTADVIVPPEGRTDAAKMRIDGWRKTVARYESDPQTSFGRRELADRARKAEQQRDFASEIQKVFKLSSAITQISIIILSASIIVSTTWLTWLGASFGMLGFGLGVLVWTKPAWLVGLHLL